MTDYLYWCQYDEAKTGTRFTIELYGASGRDYNSIFHPIDKSEYNRRELPYNTLSVKDIDISLHDSRLGLSGSPFATIDVDFRPLQQTDFLNDFQSIILKPSKKFRYIRPFLTVNVGTTWQIYEQHKLEDGTFSDKILRFTGQHIIGLSGEFNFSSNQITLKVENITSFILKRMNLRMLLDDFRGWFSENLYIYATPQVFYHHVDDDIASGGGRRSLMFSVWNINPKGSVNPSNNGFYVGTAMMQMQRIYPLLEYIDKEILEAVYQFTRHYKEPPTYKMPYGLYQLIRRSFPLYKQKYDNSGDLGVKLNDVELFFIFRIKGNGHNGAAYYYDISSPWFDNLLFTDGHYKYALDFITDLVGSFCVFGNFTEDGISLDNLPGSPSEMEIEIDLDTDGIEHKLNFGLSKYSKINVSNLECYSEDIRENVYENDYTEAEDSLNIMTLFHNQPPNNKEGWFVLNTRYPIYSNGASIGNFNNQTQYINWGHFGGKKNDGYVLDILKQNNRLGEKFTLNLFYLENGENNIYDLNSKFISVHNGVKGLKVNYPTEVIKPHPNPEVKQLVSPTGRQTKISEDVMKIQAEGCFHNTIATYIADCFNTNSIYPFCIMTLKIPVKQFDNLAIKSNISIEFNSSHIYSAILKNAVSFKLNTKHKLVGLDLSANNKWIPYACRYNVSDGYYEIVLHNVTKN